MSEADLGIEIAHALMDDALRTAGYLPRYSMFRVCADGWLIGWLIEPFDGKYASMAWKPIGPGARSGKAQRWTLVDRLTMPHRTRRQAKARATRLWYQHEGETP